MISLVDAANRAGYTVISNRGLTVVEIADPGNWEQFKKVCELFVLSSQRCDHVTVVVRSADGKRELRDVGTCDLRNSKAAEQLQSVSFCKQVAGRTRRTETLLGVHPYRNKFSARVQTCVKGRRKFVYLGLYKDRVVAAMARDQYVIQYGVKTPLNFPSLAKGA